MASVPSCRWCAAPLRHTFVDLGMSPLCESYLSLAQLNDMEPFYPLHVWACGNCFLVQLEAYVRPEAIFSDYAYFSSFSDSWVAHINGGFFIFARQIFAYIRDQEELVDEPFRRLCEEKQLIGYPYDGFWAGLDTLKDRQHLESLWASGAAPWEVWRRAEPRKGPGE